jgi:hypothetical protein
MAFPASAGISPGTLAAPAGVPTGPLAGSAHAGTVPTPSVGSDLGLGTASIPAGLGVPTGSNPQLNLLRPIVVNDDQVAPTTASPATSAPSIVPAFTGSAPSPARALSPAAGGGPYRTATFKGFVLDAETHATISGAIVSWTSQGGTCPSNVCIEDRPAGPPTGNFSIVGPAPVDTITASANLYLSNFTTISNVVPGTVYTGIYIYLEKEGTVSGVIEGNDPSHELVTCSVTVSSQSRDGTTLGASVVTANGKFSNLPVPPLPTEISFDPTNCAEYEANWYWINVSAYGSFNMGVVYLPVNDRFQASVYDSVTHQAVSMAELQVCPYENPGNCALKGATAFNNHPTAWGAPGYVVATIWATDSQNGEGSLVNTTMIGYVPPLPPNRVYNIGSVYVVALGVVAIKVGLTFDRQLVAHKVLSSWPTGDVVATPSSLDGYGASDWSNYNPMTRNFSSGPPPTSCLPISAVTQKAPYGIYAPPLRDSIKIEPDTAGNCAPTPTWPIPAYLPVWGNQTLVNVTPDNKLYSNITPSVWFNLTPGTYVEIAGDGNAAQPYPSLANAQGSPLSGGDTPRDYSGLGESYPSEPTASPAPPRSSVNFDVPGCPYSWFIMCIPVQFGPTKLTLTDGTQGGASFQNFTWIDVPPGDYGTSPTAVTPLKVNQVDTEPLLNTTGSGAPTKLSGVGGLEFENTSLYGQVLINSTNEAVFGQATIKVEEAGALSTVSAIGDSVALANSTNGDFSMSSPFGWVQVTVSDPLYESNWTWVDVLPTPLTASGNPKPIFIGKIYLTPLATIQGQVLTGGGAPILLAKTQYCAISSAKCVDIGTTGTTNSYGQYSGLLQAAPLPQGAYRLQFSATGYSSNSTWVNVTVPGAIYTGSTVRLYQTTSAAAPVRAAPVPAATASAAEWVVGNVIDNVTGLPPQSLAITWAAPGGVPTQLGTTDVNALDDFNTSIPVGAYYLNFSSPIYYPVSILINVSGLDAYGVDFLTTVTMQPYPFFSGRVLIGPQNWTYLSENDGLASGQTTVQIFNQQLTNNGPTETIDSGGFYNVSGPAPANAKQHDIAKVVPNAAGAGTATGGFNQSNFNVLVGSDAVYVNVTPAILDIYGIAYTFVRDASTNNSTPVRYPTASIFTYQKTGNKTAPAGNTTTMLDGSGGEVFGITPAWNSTPTKPEYFNISVPVCTNTCAYLAGISTNGSVGWGSVVGMTNISLVHFGWVAGPITGSVTHDAVPWASVTVSTVVGKGNATTSGFTNTTSQQANGAGFVNSTAAPGQGGFLNVSAPDYNNSVSYGFVVNESATTSIVALLANSSSRGANSSSGGLVAWGWVRGQLRDNAQMFPLYDAFVQVGSRYGATGTSVYTNVTGGYFTDAPVGPGANVSMTLTDYLGNYTHVSVASALIAPASLVNMTGDGIIAGIVVAYPSGGPVGFANLSLCPGKDVLCQNDEASANGSGIFWMAGPPGLDTLTVSFTNFVSTSILVNLTSDEWQWVGQIDLDEYAYLTGEVIGLPTGIPIPGANVSTCSVLAFQESGSLICPYATMTNGGGLFELAVPASNYILQANATFFNTSFVPIQLSPGENVSVGLIELEAYGLATGTVLAADTLQPVPGTLVTACPTWVVGNCTSSNTTSAGQYQFDGPPGPYRITASGGAYLTTELVYTLLSDQLVTVPTIYLEPVGSGARFTVQGTVYAQSTVVGNPAKPFAGAVVSDSVGDTGSSDANGHFTLSVSYGTYTVTVVASGYRAASAVITVRGNSTGLDFTLVPMTYTWSGYVTDGVNGGPLPGVNVALGGLTLSQTDNGGYYAFALQNGTFELTASYPAIDNRSKEFATVAFTIAVNGANGTRNVIMLPPGRNLIIEAVNGPSGIPIPNASVVVTGVVHPENVNESFVGSTNINGTVEIQSYTGNYTVTVAANGYLTKSVSLAAPSSGPATITLTVALNPVPPTVAGSTGLSPEIGAALAGGVVALAAGVFLLTRRLSAAGRSATPAQG